MGKRGRGKTTLAKTLINQSDYDKVYILDYLAEFGSFQSERVYVQNVGLKSFCFKVWDESYIGRKTLVVFDEVHLYGKNDIRINHLFRLGRHKGIDVVSITQRFYDMPVIVRSQTDIFHVFQITEERDLMYLSHLIPKSTVQLIRNLEQFQYVSITL